MPSGDRPTHIPTEMHTLSVIDHFLFSLSSSNTKSIILMYKIMGLVTVSGQGAFFFQNGKKEVKLIIGKELWVRWVKNFLQDML